MNDKEIRQLARILRDDDSLSAKTQWLIVSAAWLIAIAVIFVNLMH